jgi:hypothetical protein
VVSCSFDTLEQCKWTSSGRSGDWFRDPWLPAADTLAYAPHTLHARPKAHYAADHNRCLHPTLSQTSSARGSRTRAVGASFRENGLPLQMRRTGI